MTTLLDTAASLHATHLSRAERALEQHRLDVFWLHSRICDTISQVLEELKVLPSSSPTQATDAPDTSAAKTNRS